MSIATRLANPDVEDETVGPHVRAPANVTVWFDAALPCIFGYFLPRVGGWIAVAEDLTQETILAVVHSDHAPPGNNAVMPWLFGIARHKLMDHYRREDRERRHFGRPVDPDEIGNGPAPSGPAEGIDRAGGRSDADRGRTPDRCLEGGSECSLSGDSAGHADTLDSSGGYTPAYS